MKNLRFANIFGPLLVLFLAVFIGCEPGNLGLYFYPQAVAAQVPSVVLETTLPDRAEKPQGTPFEVVGYLPDYQISNVDPSIAKHLTDIIYFSFWPNSDGTLGSDIMTQSQLEFLRKVKADYGVRVLIGIADHTKRGPLLKIANSDSLRVKFAEGLADYLASMKFEGADFDWEYPAEDDLPAYTKLLEQLKNSFVPRGLKLTVAVSPSHPIEKAAYELADRVHGMMYDDWGQHSTLANSEFHVKEMIEQGVDPQKLQLGVPFYGRGYTKKGPSWESALSYKSLQGRFTIQHNQDTVSGYYFNGIDTIQDKVRYAKANGLSGIMVWEIGLDTNDSTSLLKAISDVRRAFN